ncbi:MAG: BON domain-containing protein [Fimbriimonadaceae bacterium]
MMNKIGILVLALMCFGAFGCNDTVKGAATDTKQNTEVAADATKEAADNVAKTADKMADDVGEATADAAATTLTARIKSALIANPITNDPNAKINVESDRDMVRLEGTVASDKQKNEASEIAKAILKEVGATQKFENNLKVQ